MVDYFIVGFGLGGMALASRMEEQGKSFRVFEDYSQKSSRVAGGILNPVNLRHFKMAWNADKQLVRALPFYKNLEQKLNTSFLRKTPIYRPFTSIEEENDWFAAAGNKAFEPFLNTKLTRRLSGVKSQFSFGKLNKTYLLDTGKLLEHYVEYLKERHQFINEKFDYRALEVKSDHVLYKGEKARHIIFSEGMGICENPFFDYLPVQGNKGEYIIIKAERLKLKVVVKGAVFIIPIGNNLYKVGATYERDVTDQAPSIKAKMSLEKSLKSILDCTYEIVDQVAGTRPTLPDRRPIIGKHPKFDNLWLCNGFGSRGTLIAPVASAWLLLHIEKDRPLPEEVQLKRFAFPEN